MTSKATQNTPIQGTSAPSGAQMLRAALRLQVGEACVFNAPEDVVRRHIQPRMKGRLAAFDIQSTPGGVRVTRAPWTERSSLRARMLSMALGDTIRITGYAPQSVRAVASSLSTEDELFSVHMNSFGEAHITKVDRNAPRNSRARYPFAEQVPGSSFTIPKGQHSGIAVMRSQCARHSAGMSLVFQARENIDGSVTVRCWAIGGMPPKWAIDRDHADVQEAIQRQQQAKA